MNTALFKRLVWHAAQAGDPVTTPDQSRWIKRMDTDDSNLMTFAIASARIVTRQIRLVSIKHNNACFFCTFGLPEPDEVPPDLEIIDATPGIFSVAILEANVFPRGSITGATVKEVLNGRFKDNGEEYDGHELSEIQPLFPSIVVYRATANADFHKIIDRVLGSILVRTYYDGPISLEPDTVSTLTRVFEAESALIPFRNLVQGVLSISWENIFLEIYRCIEQIYGLKRFQSLKEKLNFSSSPRDLAIILEDHLSWRPKESDAFIALVTLCDEATVSTMCIGMTVSADSHDKRCSKLAESLYELRNTIVHYRPIHKELKKTDADWNVIVRGMLNIVSELYNNHAEDFFSSDV